MQVCDNLHETSTRCRPYRMTPSYMLPGPARIESRRLFGGGLRSNCPNVALQAPQAAKAYGRPMQSLGLPPTTRFTRPRLWLTKRPASASAGLAVNAALFEAADRPSERSRRQHLRGRKRAWMPECRVHHPLSHYYGSALTLSLSWY